VRGRRHQQIRPLGASGAGPRDDATATAHADLGALGERIAQRLIEAETLEPARVQPGEGRLRASRSAIA
jgi:hypothetical protein